MEEIDETVLPTWRARRTYEASFATMVLATLLRPLFPNIVRITVFYFRLVTHYALELLHIFLILVCCFCRPHPVCKIQVAGRERSSSG